MTGSASIEARLARRRRAVGAALVVSAATTVITGCAHSLAGGAAPDALLLATALVATLVVLAPVLAPGRRSSRSGKGARAARPLSAVALAQLLQHVLYSLPESAAHAAGHAHVHDAGAAMQSAAVVHEHASMPLAHVAAGLLTLALLRLVPPAIEAMLAAMSPRLAAAALGWTPATEPTRASVTTVSPARRAALDVLRSALQRRGPPLAIV